ncbi:MAG: hypothetical protein ACK5MY_03515 [Jhaorihella sp.]
MVPTYLAIALALLLSVTGQTMAVARGSAASVGEMVLCTGTGPVTVYVDEDGQPTKPPYVCPECVMHLVVAALPSDPAPVRLPRTECPFPVRDALVDTARSVFRATARSPPV